jgi:hypothetical protein
MIQLVTPNPNIPCKPGWCLQYVRQAFGAPIVEPTATAGWANADYKHADWNFPPGCWVPVWFHMDTEPAGHVVLRAPDGSVYSTSHPTSTTPTHHPNMAHLFQAYARYNPLTYLGWSEDISGVRVVQEARITVQTATITAPAELPKEWDEMASKEEIFDAVWGGPGTPMIFNNELQREEYPRTTLGAMTDRIVRQQLVPLRAEVAGLVGALQAVAGGEPFDEAKLLEGIRAASKAGAAEAFADGIELTAKVKEG